MLERGIILIVFVDAILTMSRENFQFVKFVAIHLRLLKLGKVFLFLNKDRSFIWPDIVVLSRILEWLNIWSALHVVHLEILCEIQYFVREELLLRLQIRQDICLRLLQKSVNFVWNGMGRHVHFWNAYGLHYVWDKGFHSDLSSKGGVKIYISGRWEISCTCMTSYLVVLMVDNIVNERITLRSWDFAEYHLRMICFRCGKLVNGSIILHSWDLSDYHLWATDLSRFSMLNEHYDGQRAQPTLGLHSLCFVVESCDVFVGNWTLFEPFGNIATVFRREWKLLGISSRLESSLPFAQKQLLGFCDLWTVFELNTQRYSLAQARARETECVLKRCLLSGVIWAREHGKLDSGLFESLWVTLIAIGFALVFKVQLSGAKFYAFHLFHLFVLGWCFPVPGLVRTALTFILFLTLVLVITLDFFGLGLPGFPGCSWVSVCRCDFNLHLWLFCLNLLLSITALLSLDWSGLLWTFLANGVNQRALSEPQLSEFST